MSSQRALSDVASPAVPSGAQFEIAHKEQRAVIVEVGGGLRAYSAGGRPVLDGYRVDEQCAAGRGQVLIPWPNRLQDGRYEFDGRAHQLPLTEPERQNAIHGLVRWVNWTVREHEPDSVAIEHLLPPQPGYPFSVALRIEYSLSDDGLRVTTTATNLGSDPCPFGAGAHPYLSVPNARVDDAVLCVPAQTLLRTDQRGIPIGAESVEGTDYDFRRPRRIGTPRLDHCFTELERDDDGRVRVALGNASDGTTVTLWVDGSYPYLMLFTGDTLPEVGRRSLAIEPMTCPPNAFATGESVIVLEPGAECRSEWGITLQTRLRGTS